MKRTLLFVTILSLHLFALAQTAPKREFRATWFTTHYAIDWPSTYITTTGSTKQIAAQKAEMDAILDALVEGHMNAFCMQIRPTADAFYKSSYEPWSKNLSGTRGKDPGYDPLAYAVEQGHKRGLEVHVWVNPFRVVPSGSIATSDPVWQNCKDWIIQYSNGSFYGQIIDPGFPQARAYVIKVLMEAINNYDVDGILMDDYFYPYGGTTTEDATSKSLYKPAGMNDGDWRRSNVDSTMKALYDTIQAVKPWVRFGMGPFGIWTTQKSVAQKYGISLPTGITGLDDYAVQFCNTVEWVKGGYVDYIAPQLYWATTSTGQDYDVLCKWWAQDVCKHFSDLLPGDKKVDFFVSQAAYRFNTDEINLEIDDNRKFDQTGCPGSIFYNTTSYIKDNGQGTVKMHKAIAASKFASRALPPAMSWKAHPTLGKPSNLHYSQSTLTWSHASSERFTVYCFPTTIALEDALATGKYLQGMVYGKEFTLSVKGDKVIAVCAFDRFGNEFAPDTIHVHGGEEPGYEPQVEGNMTLLQLWAHPVAGSECLTTGSAHRSITYHDGQLYISDGVNSKVHILDAEDGAFVRTEDLTSSYHIWHNIRATDSGYLLLGNTGTSSGALKTHHASIATPGTTTANTEYTITDFGRSDFFYLSPDHSFITMLSNVNHKLLKAAVKNGVIQTPTVISHTELPAGTSAKALPYSDTTCLCQASSCWPSLHRIATGKKIDSFSGTDQPEELACSGMAWFDIGGKRFVLTPHDIQGSFDIFDATQGLSKAKHVMKPTESIGSASHAAFTIDFAIHSVGDTAYIYVLAPDNGVAAYRFHIAQGTGVEQVEIVSCNHTTYNILGQPVDEHYHGIVIRDGHKYLQ